MRRDHFSFNAFTILACEIILLLGSISATNVDAAKQPDPTEQFRPFVEKMVTILTEPNRI